MRYHNFLCSVVNWCKIPNCFAELLKMCEFLFTLSGTNNSSVEWVFSNIYIQWIDKRN